MGGGGYGGYPPRFPDKVIIGIIYLISTNNTTILYTALIINTPNPYKKTLSTLLLEYIMIKTELFNECIHSEEPDLTCPFAENVLDQVHCSQTLGWLKASVDVQNLKKCFMTASPRDKVSMVNKIQKNPG